MSGRESEGVGLEVDAAAERLRFHVVNTTSLAETEQRPFSGQPVENAQGFGSVQTGAVSQRTVGNRTLGCHRQDEFFELFAP